MAIWPPDSSSARATRFSRFIAAFSAFLASRCRLRTAVLLLRAIGLHPSDDSDTATDWGDRRPGRRRGPGVYTQGLGLAPAARRPDTGGPVGKSRSSGAGNRGPAGGVSAAESGFSGHHGLCPSARPQGRRNSGASSSTPDPPPLFRLGRTGVRTRRAVRREPRPGRACAPAGCRAGPARRTPPPPRARRSGGCAGTRRTRSA